MPAGFRWQALNHPGWDSVTRAIKQLFRLSIADLLDEWPVGVAVILAIAAVLAPLLVMNGLRAGVIGEIFERLRADPAMRRITLDATGATRFDPAWFQAMNAREDVAFVLPSTRFAASQAKVTPADDDGSVPILRIWLVPTGAGDPVFEPGSPAIFEPYAQVKVASAVADRAKLTVGSRLFIDVTRRGGDGRTQTADMLVTVVDIALPERHGGTVVFGHPDLLGAIEAFRDGFTAPEIGVPDGEARKERSSYPNFRLYAGRIEDVTPLASHLRKEQGLSVSAQEGPIASAIQLDRNVRAVLDAIMLLGATGLAGSLCAIQWAVAARKRRVVAMLSLMGYGGRWLIGFPAVQASVLASMGVFVAATLSLGAAAWINRDLAESFGATGAACVIEPVLLAGGAAGVLLLSLVPAIMIGIGFTRVDPSDEIRDV